MQHFARNTVGPGQAAAWAGHVAAQPLQHWLLVDHAIVDSTRSARAARVLGWPSVPALASSALQAFGESGPHLHAMPALSAGPLAEALARWIAIEPTAAGLSIISSTAGAGELQAALSYLAMVVVDGDTRVHCRCADARVIPNLLPMLHMPQARRISTAITAWSWLDSIGQVAHWRGAQGEHAEADRGTHLRLDAAQFGQMMDAAEPDIVFAMLMDKTAELVPAAERGEFRARLARLLATAAQFGVKQTPDKLQFVVLSLATGEDFHRHPGLQAMWQRIRDQGASLRTEMQAWSDDLWAEIDHGRRPAQ